jgi:hypothetical protein
VATITRLKSGSWRVQVRRKGKYVNETFLRRKDAEEWGIDIERRIDRQEPTTTHKSRDVQLFGDLVALHRQDLEEVGKDIGRFKTASLIFLEERLGHLRLPELDRERFIKFGKERALEGAGPVTVGIDLGYIKTILSHAAAVHGVVVSTEPIDLARIALGRLGLVGKAESGSGQVALCIRARRFYIVQASSIAKYAHSSRSAASRNHYARSRAISMSMLETLPDHSLAPRPLSSRGASARRSRCGLRT